MEIIHLDLNKQFSRIDGLTLALGTFDGFHKAHAKLAYKARLESSSSSGILLFSTSPELFLSRNKSKEVLTSLDDKIRYISKVGLDYCFIIDVTQAFFDLTPVEFIEKVLIPLGVKTCVTGKDYSFGKFGKGDIYLLQKYFKVFALDIEYIGDEKISSSLIKEFIKQGDVRKAFRFLSHPYEIYGLVKEGFHNGRNIGFPTINISFDSPYVMPKNGVYFGLTYVNGIPYKSMINVGNNPTVGKLEKPIIEAHLLNFDQDIYNKHVYISFLSFLRDEKKFASLEELKIQLEKDKKRIEEITSIQID